MKTLTYSTTLTLLSCGVCAVPFAMPIDLHQSALDSGRVFYCPNGHHISYSETENAKLKRQVERKTALLAQADQRLTSEQRSHSATKGQLTRAKKRSAAGTCPYCSRSFKQVRQHVTKKHPDEAPLTDRHPSDPAA